MNIKISSGNAKLGSIPSISLPVGITCRGDCECQKKCITLKQSICIVIIVIYFYLQYQNSISYVLDVVLWHSVAINSKISTSVYFIYS